MQVVAFVQEPARNTDLFKVPGVAETIDWTEGIDGSRQESCIDPETVDETLGSAAQVSGRRRPHPRAWSPRRRDSLGPPARMARSELAAVTTVATGALATNIMHFGRDAESARGFRSAPATSARRHRSRSEARVDHGRSQRLNSTGRFTRPCSFDQPTRARVFRPERFELGTGSDPARHRVEALAALLAEDRSDHRSRGLAKRRQPATV